MGIELRFLGTDGKHNVLPDVEGVTLSPILCDAGTIEFSYPVDGINAGEIIKRDEFELAIFLDGVRRPELDGIIKDVDGDDIAEGATWKFTGFFNNGRMAEAMTYPANWPDVDPEFPSLTFTESTAGEIMGTLLQQAHQRGTLLDITYSSFTSATDSNGIPWDLHISLEYKPQVSYLDVLKNLYEQGLCEWQVVGKELRMYRRESMSIDRTLSTPPLVFRKGRDLVDSPRKRTTRDLATAFLTAGSQGLFHEAVNEAEVARRRRIERGDSQGNVSDEGTLIAYTDIQVANVSTPKMEKTHGLQFADEDTPRPIRHFNVGDWAYTDTGVGLERLRVKQWTIHTEANGVLTGSVTLNDFFAEQAEKNAKRIDGIIGGSTLVGGSRAEGHMPPEAADGMPPARPEGLTLSSSAYVDASGQTLAQVTASWQAVTENQNGTILEDLGRYLIEYQLPEVYTADAWLRVDAGTSTARSWSSIPAGTEVRVRVRAEDKWGNPSEWSLVQNIESGADVTPPPVPSAPVVDNYLGLLRAYWDGKFLNNQARPTDFSRIDVHVSSTNNFTPTAATLAGPLSASGSVFIEAPYGERRYVRFVAYDATGNASGASVIGDGVSSQVVSDDVFDGAIGSAKLADLAVITAKIADLAVNDAKIGSLSVGKLTAGIMNAEVTISGRLATALTGKRVEMNGIGFQGWDSNGNQTISLDGVDNLMTGRYRTALTGRRIEFGLATSQIGRMEFYSPSDLVSEIAAFTPANSTNEIIQMRIRNPGTATGWNAVQIGSDDRIGLLSGRIEVEFGGEGDSSVTPSKFFRVRWKDHGRASGSTGTSLDRILANNTDTRLFGMGGGVIALQRWVNNTTAQDRYVIFGNDNHHWYPGMGLGRMELNRNSGNVDHSPYLVLFTEGGWGNAIRVERRSDNVVLTQFVSFDGGAWGYCQAAGWDVMSDEVLKDDIAEVSMAERNQIVDQFLTVKAKSYTLKGDRNRTTRDGEPIKGKPPTRVGLVAQEAPAFMVNGKEGAKSIGLYEFITGVLMVTQRLNERITELEKGK